MIVSTAKKFHYIPPWESFAEMKSKRREMNKWPLMIALIVLTVLSSCTVRKAIQAQLDVPVERQLNPSKSILTGGASCTTTDILPAAHPTEFSGIEFTAFLVPLILNLRLLIAVEPIPFVHTQTVGISDKIPFYILYKKLKIRLL